jgi:DNA-binding NtrC family response regulator
MTDLERYAWPGNVRELANLLEGVASLLPAGETTIRQTPGPVRRALSPSSDRPASVPGPAAAPIPFAATAPTELETLDAIERRAIEHALKVCNGNLAQAARSLGVARNTLYNKLARYGVKVAPHS